jgi:hypothetical protein
MKTTDFKSIGVVLLAPGDLGFEAGVDLAVAGTQSDFVRQIKAASVVLKSSATKRIIGYAVNWEYWSTVGRVFTRGIVRDASDALLDPGRAEPSQEQTVSGRVIGPGEALLVSMFVSLGKTESDVMRYWRREYIDDIARPDGSVEMRAVLDGIMFEDGTFAGPNRNLLFEKIVGEFDAVQDAYRHIVTMAASGLEKDLVAWAVSLSSDPSGKSTGKVEPGLPWHVIGNSQLDGNEIPENL